MTPEHLEMLQKKLAQAKNDLADWKYSIFINEHLDKTFTEPAADFKAIVESLKGQLPEYEAEVAFYEEVLAMHNWENSKHWERIPVEKTYYADVNPEE